MKKAVDWILPVVVVGGLLYLGWSVWESRAPAPVTIVSTFDAGEAAYIHRTGEGEISGRVFVRLWSGEEVPGCGKPVLLVPQTALSRERMGHLYGTAATPALRDHVKDRARLEAPDPQYRAHMRQAVCDETGRFRFAGLADGGYFVVGSVVWRGHAVSLMQPVEVRGGERVDVVMTPGGET